MLDWLFLSSWPSDFTWAQLRLLTPQTPWLTEWTKTLESTSFYSQRMIFMPAADVQKSVPAMVFRLRFVSDSGLALWKLGSDEYRILISEHFDESSTQCLARRRLLKMVFGSSSKP